MPSVGGQNSSKGGAPPPELGQRGCTQEHDPVANCVHRVSPRGLRDQVYTLHPNERSAHEYRQQVTTVCDHFCGDRSRSW